MDVSGDLKCTPTKDERPTRSSTPDPEASGKGTPALDASVIEVGRSADAKEESFKSAVEEPRQFAPDQLTDEQIKAAANNTTPKSSKKVSAENKKTSDKKSSEVDYNNLSKNGKHRHRAKQRKARALEKKEKLKSGGRITKSTANSRTPAKHRLGASHKNGSTPAHRTPTKSRPNPKSAPPKGPRTPTKKAPKSASNHPQPEKKVHPAAQARGEPTPQIARLRGVIKAKEVLIRKKDTIIDELGRKQLARCSLLLADCKPGKLVERLHAADNQIKKRPFTNASQWVSQHNEAVNLLMCGRPAEWMSTCGSSALPENFFCTTDSMHNTTKMMLERVPDRFRNVLVAASSLLTAHYLSNLDVIAPPPLPILKMPNSDDKVTRPSLGTAQKPVQLE